MYQALKDYKIAHHDREAAYKSIEYPDLSIWCGIQRALMAQGQLFPEREKLLRKAGFDLFPLHTKWNTMLVASRE
jgi:hypothetical protein